MVIRYRSADRRQLIITWMSNINDVPMVMGLLSCFSRYGSCTYAHTCDKQKFGDRRGQSFQWYAALETLLINVFIKCGI